MRRTSYLAFLFCLLLVGSGVRGANAQQTDPPPTKKITRIRQGGNITVKALKHKVQPHYPQEARDNRIQGTVRLHVLLSIDGKVQQLEAISGDPILVKAAVEAVRQWEYRATLLNGEPVEVDTTVDVIFSLGL